MTDRDRSDEAALRSASAEAWSIAMTRHASVTGTAGEVTFGPWLAEQLAGTVALDRATVWTFPIAPDDGRRCVAMLVRGSGRATVLLTGHYDTVATDDYGDLTPVATDPIALKDGLARRLALMAASPAERRARADLETGLFLPGRGLLDMKAGLAAGIAVAERFAAGTPHGNLLFVAVPDEEASSAGARRAAVELDVIARRHDLDLRWAINLDAIADDGDGTAGRSVALGTIGKLLPTAFVVGLPTHAGFPAAGLNAAVLAAAIVRRVEWAVELTDPAGPATPSSLLMMRDGKIGYDVTTPATAFAAFNVQLVHSTAEQVLDAFDALCRDAVAAVLGELRERARGFGPGAAIEAVREVPVMRFAALCDHVRKHDPLAFAALGTTTGPWDGSLPESCQRLTAAAWRASGLPGPAVITGFGSVPYLPTALSGSAAACRLREVTAEATLAVGLRHTTTIRCDPVFAGISDMSFLGEADETLLPSIADNTPGWIARVGWPAHGGIAGLPIINAGPWGRDYHTPLERIETHYGFVVLPDLLQTIVGALLDPSPSAEGYAGIAC